MSPARLSRHVRVLSRSNRRWVHALCLALLSTALTISATGGAMSVATPKLRNVAPPLVSSITNGQTSWSVVVMGRHDGSFNLFPELFSLTASGSRWSLVTPPGVADNGGLFIGTGTAGSALAGIGPSQALAFSPLAFSMNSGRSWTPGALEAGLHRVPSAIALGPDERAAVLVDQHGSQTVLQRNGSLEQWTTLVSAKALATAEPDCGVTALNAIDITADGRYLLGATCSRPGSLGLFSGSAGHWSAVTATIPSALSTSAFETIRLSTINNMTEAIFAVRGPHSTSIVAGWSGRTTQPWSLSRPINLAQNAEIVATGAGPEGAESLVVRTGTNLEALISNGATRTWQRIASLPISTQSIAIEPSGAVDAFVVRTSRLSVWREVHQGGAFAKSQTINVPIAYGSSA